MLLIDISDFELRTERVLFMGSVSDEVTGSICWTLLVSGCGRVVVRIVDVVSGWVAFGGDEVDIKLSTSSNTDFVGGINSSSTGTGGAGR